jgi:hypothetical protein
MLVRDYFSKVPRIHIGSSDHRTRFPDQFSVLACELRVVRGSFLMARVRDYVLGYLRDRFRGQSWKQITSINLNYRTNNTLIENFQVNTLNELTANTNGGKVTVMGTTMKGSVLEK